MQKKNLFRAKIGRIRSCRVCETLLYLLDLTSFFKYSTASGKISIRKCHYNNENIPTNLQAQQSENTIIPQFEFNLPERKDNNTMQSINSVDVEKLYWHTHGSMLWQQ